jgi:hypothetical protein
LYDFLAWLEASALGHAIRSSGVWTYGIVNLTHIFGVATLFGSMLALDLRLLGAWRSVPLGVLAKPTVPLAATGFTVAVLSGICMLATNATEYAGNPFIYIAEGAAAARRGRRCVARLLAHGRHGRADDRVLVRSLTPTR